MSKQRMQRLRKLTGLPPESNNMEVMYKSLDILNSVVPEHMPLLLNTGLNLGRVNNLIRTYTALHGGKKGRKGVFQADILRAAVVLLYATLEDFLRTLMEQYLPKAGKDALNSIPLVGTSESGKASKFFLGELAQFRELSVGDLITQSVQEHAKTASFGSVESIFSLLRSLNLEVNGIDSFAPALAELIERRHHIVHRADRITDRGRGKQVTRSISVRKVNNWYAAVIGLVLLVSGQITEDIMRAKGYS